MIYDDILKAFRQSKLDRDYDKNLFLSVLVGEIQNKAVTMVDGQKTYNDADVIKVLKSAEKMIHENLSLENMPESGRIKFKRELEIVEDFLPQQMTESDIRQYMTTSGLKTLPELMKFMKDNHAGTYDGKSASMIAKELTS